MGQPLQDDVGANFHYQKLRFYLQRLSRYKSRRRLTADLQNQKHKIQSNIFENIFSEAAHH